MTLSGFQFPTDIMPTDSFRYQATECLILPSPRKHYPAFMHAGHWQLRSFISSPNLNQIHYLGGRDIYHVDTSNLSRQIADTLPFLPRCLTSANGWICCGGENGKFSALRLGSKESSASSVREADDRLPLDLDPFRRLHLGLGSRDSISRNEATVGRHPSQVKIIGREILNCITLWFPRPGNAESAYTNPVAVVASNDHCTYIIGLESLEVIQSLEQKEPINLGRISPDGSLLIVVGDDPYMHVYKRKLEGGSRKNGGEYSWSKWSSVQLPGQRVGDQDEMRGSFTGAFSDRYLAVGTQYGVIAVFETQHLLQSENPRPIVTFPTTRPGTRSGAVRSLQFSPSGPYDLLAVTEDGGRVIVADVRHLCIRQVIDMDPNSEELEVVALTESTGDHLIDPRLQSDLDATDDESTTPYNHRLVSRMSRDNHQLTREDTEVLEAMQIERRRREREANPNPSSVTWNDVSDELHSRIRASDRRLPTSNLPGSLRELLTGRNNDSLRAFILERNQEREQRGLPPRRRGFVAAARAALDTEAGDADGTTDNPSTDSETPPRITLHLPSSLGIHSSSNSWAEIEAIYNMAIEPPDPTSRMQIEIEDEVRRDTIRQADELATTRRLQNGALRGPNGPASGTSIRTRYLGRHSTSHMSQTTGCCWSPDSHIL